MMKARRNTVEMCWVFSQAALVLFLPLTLFTWRFPDRLDAQKGRLRPTMPRDLTSETEPPYMVLQPLYATYTDQSRGSCF